MNLYGLSMLYDEAQAFISLLVLYDDLSNMMNAVISAPQLECSYVTLVNAEGMIEF